MLGQEWVRHRRDPLVVERRSLAQIAARDRRDAAEDRAARMVIERDDD